MIHLPKDETKAMVAVHGCHRHAVLWWVEGRDLGVGDRAMIMH